MKFRVVCSEEVSTEFVVEAPDREAFDGWLEKEGANTVSMYMGRQIVNERDYEVVELSDKEGSWTVDVSVGNMVNRPEHLNNVREDLMEAVKDKHARLAAQIQRGELPQPSGDICKILTETPSMRAEDPNVVIQNCYIQAREGDEGFHLKSPLVIDGYAIIPKEMIITFAELLREVK